MARIKGWSPKPKASFNFKVLLKKTRLSWPRSVGISMAGSWLDDHWSLDAVIAQRRDLFHLTSEPKKEKREIKKCSHMSIVSFNSLFHLEIDCPLWINVSWYVFTVVIQYWSFHAQTEIKTPKRIFQGEAKWAKNQFLLLSIPTVWKNRSSFSWGRCWLWLQAVRFTEFLLYRARCLVPVGQLWECTTVTTSWGVGWQFEKTRAMRYSASRSRLNMKATATKINIMRV